MVNRKAEIDKTCGDLPTRYDSENDFASAFGEAPCGEPLARRRTIIRISGYASRAREALLLGDLSKLVAVRQRLTAMCVAKGAKRNHLSDVSTSKLDTQLLSQL